MSYCDFLKKLYQRLQGEPRYCNYYAAALGEHQRYRDQRLSFQGDFKKNDVVNFTIRGRKFRGVVVNYNELLGNCLVSCIDREFFDLTFVVDCAKINKISVARNITPIFKKVG